MSIVLLVEDNPMDVALTQDAFHLKLPEVELRVARNGRSALDYLLGNDQYTDRELHPLPDLVLLDLKMPGISGHDVLREVKSNAALKLIPMIVLSSSNVEKDIRQSYALGANSYLVKPIVFDEFLDVVRKIGENWLTINCRP